MPIQTKSDRPSASKTLDGDRLWNLQKKGLPKMITQNEELKVQKDESAEDAALEARIDYENTIEDLSVMYGLLGKFLELHNRGEDAEPLYADVQKIIKCMAIEFGIQQEIWVRYDKHLQSNGLKSLIVAA